MALSLGDARATYRAELFVDGALILVHDDDVPLPKGTLLEIRADGLWAELVCETVGEHWGFGLEAFGLRYEVPSDALVSDRAERVPVGLDLEWEVPDHVIGEILVGRERIPVDATGTFSSGPLPGA